MVTARGEAEMSRYVVGVDIGTSAVKSGLIDKDGVLVALASEELPLRHPRPGWVEQDLEDFYSSAIRTLCQVVQQSRVDPAHIAAIAIAGQMSGIGMINERWEPLSHYDSWLDTRCEPYIQYMQDLAGPEVLQKTGCPPTYAHCAKMLWWKEQQPAIFRKVAKFVVAGCYVAGKMAGLNFSDAFIDYTYLHYTGLADIQKMEWDGKLCAMFGIPVEKLPRIVKPTQIVGELSPKAAKACGLPPGIPIVAGAGDTTASYLGAGVVESGILFDVAGTASVLASCTASYAPDLRHGTVMCSRSAIEGMWHPIAFINGGGLCLRWFRDEIMQMGRSPGDEGDRDAYELLDELAGMIPPGSDGLLFVPHLGGRVLPAQPDLRGSWIGFSWGHTKAHFYRSILEGIAYEYYYYLKIMKELYPDVLFHEVRVLGGGAKSSLWNQIKADVLGIPYSVVSRQEPAVVGSAIIAGSGVGLFSDLKETSRRCVTVTETREPRAEYHAYYQEYAETYIRLLDDLMRSYQRFRKLRELRPPGSDARDSKSGV